MLYSFASILATGTDDPLRSPRSGRCAATAVFRPLAMIDNYHLTRGNATFDIIIFTTICGEED